MSVDGAVYPCLSLPSAFHPRGVFLDSWPLTAYNVTTPAFHLAIVFQNYPKLCTYITGRRGFHATVLRSASYGMSLSHPFSFKHEFYAGVKKQETCLGRLNSYGFEEALDLESEILDFMNQSERPDLFPSRSELLRADRSDLVEAIHAKGGWMVAGWDLEPDIEGQAQQQLDGSGLNGNAMAHRENECTGKFEKRNPTFLGGYGIADVTETSQSAHTVLTLERQKGWEKVADLFGLTSTIKEVPRTRPNGVNGNPAQAQLGGILDSNKRDLPCQSLAEGSKGRQIVAEASEKKKKRRQKYSKMSNARSNVHQADGQQAWVAQSKSRHTDADDRKQKKENNMPISHRIRGLEAELVSTLDTLKFGRHALTDDIKLKQKHSLHKVELEEASDALEFCETEIMNKKRELRTARAQQIAFEGKLALDLMEFRRSMEEKDEQLERTMQVLKTLRTARIVWPNPGREVFLAGSYDGWASWRRMEKSSAGVFVTSLQLYPGQYEMKFIVDGAWMVDPNRPKTWANGYENNVLIVM